MSESKKRSLVKALSWRVFGIVLTFFVVLIITNSSSVSTSVTILREIISTTGYFFHERIWNSISWEKQKSPD